MTRNSAAAWAVVILAGTLVGGSGTASAAPFTAGNLAIYRVGSGTGDLLNTGAAVFVDEYSSTGTLVQSIELPNTAVTGPNLVASGTATSEGLINRSADGSKLVITGYNSTIPASASLATTAGTAVNRVVGVLDASGSAALYGFSDIASSNNPRSAIVDGSKLYVGGGAGGVRYADLSTLAAGSTGNTSTQVLSFANTRHLDVFNGQLYASNDSTAGGNTVIIGSVGSGLPTATGQTYDTLPGFINHTANPGSSAYSFFMADLDAGVTGVDTLYVADDGDAGLTKYSLVSGSWTSNGMVGLNADDYRGLTGSVSGSTVTLFATREGGSGAAGGGELVSLVDPSGYNGAFAGTPTLLATAATNTAFRGIDFVPSGGVTPTNNADFNNDLKVDGADLMIWQTGLGQTGLPPGDKSTGDANGDGNVNALDLQEWKDRYGLPPSVAAAGAVPEPASAALCVLAIAGLGGLRRRPT